MAQIWIADEVIPNPQGYNEMNTAFGAPQGLEAGRIYSRGKWSLSDYLVFIACKQIDFFVYTDTNNRRTLMTTSSERWSKLEENMVTRSVIRSKSQCQEKWKILANDFKKVYDYQKNIPSGQKTYFQMDILERKNHLSVRFPKIPLAIKVYDAIPECYPRCSRAVDPGNLPFNSLSASPTHGK